MNMKNLKKGFTIIEMVIVIAIIGILAAVLIPTYSNVVSNANESAAMQTARSVMTNWLATNTTAAGVPTSGPDGKGNDFYAAYFEYKNGENGLLYQYRYTSGGVERTDDKLTEFIDFEKLNKVTCYLTTPGIDAGFTSTTVPKYAVKVYQQPMTATDGSIYYNYYVLESKNSVYDFGGADVYAATSKDMTIYVAGKQAAALDANTFANWETGDNKLVKTTVGQWFGDGIGLDESSIVLKAGTNRTLKLVGFADGTAATWASSDNSAITVDATGTVAVTGNASIGTTADITATVTTDLRDYTFTCKVIVGMPVTLTAENATIEDNITVYDGSSTVALPTKVTMSGKIFKGWYTSAAAAQTAGSDNVTSITSANVVNNAVVLYACWADAVTVTYNANGGTGSMVETNNPYAKGTVYTVRANGFAKVGYTFVGWSTTADGTNNMVSSNNTVTLNSDTTLYALWEQVQTNG